jgi:excisionase family DNA binding protein
MSKIMTMSEVAEYLKVHPSTIHRLLKHTDFPGFKLGSDWRFNLDSINQWLLKLETTSRTTAEPPDEDTVVKAPKQPRPPQLRAPSRDSQKGTKKTV